MHISLITFVLSLGTVLALPSMHSDSDTLSKAKYAVLTSNMFSGSKNVRWETKPMNYMDVNGFILKIYVILYNFIFIKIM